MTDTVTLPSTRGSDWGLAAGVAAQAQGLVTSGFGTLRAACALVLNAGKPGGGWLAALRDVAPVTPADGPRTPSVALAFTSLGLARVGVPDVLLRDFSLPFYEGMLQKDRRRSLGDAGEDDAPLASIEWGLRPDSKPSEAGTQPAPTAEVPRERPVHALLLIYHTSHDELIALVTQKIVPALSAAEVQIVRRIALDLNPDTKAPDVREHFGFVDGISQPIPYGPGTDDGGGNEVVRDPLHGVRLGDILLGYPDAHETPSRGPFMVGTEPEKGRFVPTTASPLDAAVAAMEDPASQQLRDLGLNGSYLVVRELRQDVDAFWASMQKAAGELNAASPGKPPVDAAWIAERVIGRTRDGDMLRPGGRLPSAGSLPDNDFLFFREDRHGYGCPMGSHVRRANPRDGLAYNAGVCEDLLASANAHRILRRGRKFGGVGGDTHNDDTQGKGLLFMCLNGDIARQFEFVQQNWMLNPNFATLYNEVDPLLGPESDLTLPAQPLRRRVRVATFVTLVGGDYFFLPSIATLDILAALPALEPSAEEAR